MLQFLFSVGLRGLAQTRAEVACEHGLRGPAGPEHWRCGMVSALALETLGLLSIAEENMRLEHVASREPADMMSSLMKALIRLSPESFAGCQRFDATKRANDEHEGFKITSIVFRAHLCAQPFRSVQERLGSAARLAREDREARCGGFT